ncbi:uncharacterized protein G2W53_039762 [Senna tora]|uniref:Endonuclease/exonuclease/phosphatase domain-containing protein n=1 Tax=Senna tora TaxID=362788 RepID=A0A834SQ48_9FABA|nr:uncharacterized protein G2W53_039762 [Senna tora]
MNSSKPVISTDEETQMEIYVDKVSLSTHNLNQSDFRDLGVPSEPPNVDPTTSCHRRPEIHQSEEPSNNETRNPSQAKLFNDPEDPSSHSHQRLNSVNSSVAGAASSAPWLKDWTYMIAESMFYKISDPVVRNLMREMRIRGIGLILPPSAVQSRVRPEPEINPVHLDTRPNQLLQMFHSCGNQQIFTLKGNLPEGAFLLETHKPVLDVCGTCYLKLDSGVLEHQFVFNLIQGEKALSPINSDSSDSLGYMGQNFDESDRFMDFKILAWNARGAGSAEFRRILLDMKQRYHPNVVFISETRIDGGRADNVINTLGFDRRFKVDSIGYARGLWILWDSNNVRLTVVIHTFQEVHAIMEVQSHSPFLASFVYASPILDKRRCLWKNLSSVAEHNSLPWVVCGDFNEMLHPDEKWGGNPATLGRIREFKECVERCEVVDLGFSGQKFTWFNKRADGAMVFERLDRFLANSDWIQCFPDTLNCHLPRIKLDHLPLLLVSKVINNIVMNRPFHCERVWIKEPSFVNLAETSWKEARSASHGLGLIRDRALQWNKIFFGNIF